MKEKEILKNFIAFLKKNNIYHLYLQNLKKWKCGNENSVDFIVKTIRTEPSDLIITAFPWISAKNPTISWRMLHCEWGKIVYSIGNKQL